MNYFYAKNYNGFIYTIDMVRLSTRITIFDKKNLEKLFIEHGLKFWHNGSFGKFDQNYQADKLWIGIMKEKSHQSDYATNETFLLTLEFNPNKISDFDILIFNCLINNFRFKLIRFDLACDIPHNINNLCFFDIFKKNYSLFMQDYNNKTYYIGNGDGRIKVYNKKIESNLDYELTRFEVTKECNYDINNQNKLFIDFRFPYIAFQPYLSIVDSDETLSAILFAVNNGFPYRSLSRHYKEVIKKEFVGLSDLSNNVANEVLNDFLLLIKSRHI